MNTKQAFVVGASGMVGKQLVETLSANPRFSKIVLFGRRDIDLPNPPKHLEQKKIDFENLAEYKKDFEGFDIGFCALGTSSRLHPDLFEKVDHDYVVNTAKVAKECGTSTFCLVTAASTDEKSRFQYPRVKAEAERDVLALGFDRTVITRPPMIVGEREVATLPYRMITCLLKPTMYFTSRFQVTDLDVAKSLVAASLDDSQKGKQILLADQIKKMADSYKK